MKKLLCLLLAMLMVVGLFAGCSGSGEESSSKDSAAEEESSEKEESPEEEDASDSPEEDASVTEITWYRPSVNSNGGLLTDFHDVLWIRELEARTNMKIEFQGPNSGDDYNQAVNILLGANNLPDIINSDWSLYGGGVDGAIEDGVIVPFSENEEYVELVPNFMELMKSNKWRYLQSSSESGKFAVFSGQSSDQRNLQTNMGYVIHKDWLDDLNLEIPTTVDEMYQVLTAFNENDCNGNGDPSDEIGITEEEVLYQLMTAWGLIYNKMYTDPETGEPTYWTEYQDGAAFKDYATTMRKWYAEGLLDTEIAGTDWDLKEAKVTQGQVGLFFAYPSYIVRFHDAMAEYLQDDSIELVGVTPIVGVVGEQVGTDGKVHYYQDMTQYGSVSGAAITTAAEDRGTIVPILKMMNFMYSEEGITLQNWGVEGESYEIDSEGNKQWTEAITNDPEHSLSEMVTLYANASGGDWPRVQDYWAWHSVAILSDEAELARDNWSKFDDAPLLPTGVAMTESEASDFNRIKTDVDTAISEAYVQYMIGSTDEAGIDTMLETVEDMGISNMIDIYRTAYDRYMERAASME